MDWKKRQQQKLENIKVLDVSSILPKKVLKEPRNKERQINT